MHCAVHSHISFIRKILEEDQEWFGVQGGPSMEEHNLLPNETCSYNHRYQSEIQKERIVPLALMDWLLPQMPWLWKWHRPDTGAVSVTEARSNMKCPQWEVYLSPCKQSYQLSGWVSVWILWKTGTSQEQKEKKRILWSFKDKVWRSCFQKSCRPSHLNFSRWFSQRRAVDKTLKGQVCRPISPRRGKYRELAKSKGVRATQISLIPSYGAHQFCDLGWATSALQPVSSPPRRVTSESLESTGLLGGFKESLRITEQSNQHKVNAQHDGNLLGRHGRDESC